jgi:hypothetical protein
LSLLADWEQMALREIREKLEEKVEEWAIKEDLALLKNLGLIAPVGHGRGARWHLVEQLEE